MSVYAVKCQCGEVHTIDTDTPGKKSCSCGRAMLVTPTGKVERLSSDSTSNEKSVPYQRYEHSAI